MPEWCVLRDSIYSVILLLIHGKSYSRSKTLISHKDYIGDIVEVGFSLDIPQFPYPLKFWVYIESVEGANSFNKVSLKPPRHLVLSIDKMKSLSIPSL